MTKAKSALPNNCGNQNPQACSDYDLCKSGTQKSAGGIRYWNGTTGYTREAKRRGLSCNVGLAYRVPLKASRGNRVQPYAERCNLTIPQIKEAQKYSQTDKHYLGHIGYPQPLVLLFEGGHRLSL